MRSLPRPSLLLAPLLIAAPAAAQGLGAPPPPASTGVRTAAGELVELELPAGTPEAFSLRLPRAAGALTLVLERRSVRARGFRLLAQDEAGRMIEVPAPDVSTYRGGVLELPGARVAATLVPGGVQAAVLFADGAALFVEPEERERAAAGRPAHRLLAQDELELGAGWCGAELLGAPPSGPPAAAAGGGSGCFRVAELAVDCDHENYLLNGADVAATTLNLEAVVNAVNEMYAREVRISHELTQVVVRSAEPDPYTSFDPGTILGELRAEWNGPLAGVPRDAAHLATGKEMDGNIIGLAYVGVTCNLPWAYGLTQFNLGFGGNVSVLAHELGHNWNAPHCLDAPCVIMCGGCLAFGPITTDVVLAYRDAVGCLETTDGHPDPVPPKVRDEEYLVEGGFVADVLANDFDGNCDALVLEGFDATGEAGGTVELSAGTGPGGRDELRYTPAAGFQGTDRFHYLVGDGTGLATEGEVTVHLYDARPDLALHLRFDELDGSLLEDASGHGLDGTYAGTPGLGAPGAAPGTGTAVAFDGAFDRATILDGTPLTGLTRELTVAVWVRPDQLSGARRILGNGSSWRFALREGQPLFATASEDLLLPVAIPAGVWTHLAAVWDADFDVTFYADGVALGTVAGGGPAGTAGPTWGVASAGVQGALFDGLLDDLQLYDHPLSEVELRYLYEHPGATLPDCGLPQSYCIGAPNSVGAGASLTASGTTSVAADDLQLVAMGCPPHRFGLFFYGPTQVQLPFGEGWLCVGGGIFRLPLTTTDLFGIAILELDLESPPSEAGRIDPGEPWSFQFWYRDPAGGPAGFNLTDALGAVFCP